MCGIVSIPVAFVAALFGMSNLAAWITLCVAALLVCGIRMAYNCVSLEDQMKPRLTVFYDHANQECDIDLAPKDERRALRLLVRNIGLEAVERGQGRLIKIVRDGLPIWRDRAVLTFAPNNAPDRIDKIIYSLDHERLDLIWIDKGGNVDSIGTPDHVWPVTGKSLKELFSDKGDYILTIQIVGNRTPTVEKQFKLTLGADRFAAKLEELEYVSASPKEDQPT